MLTRLTGGPLGPVGPVGPLGPGGPCTGITVCGGGTSVLENTQTSLSNNVYKLTAGPVEPVGPGGPCTEIAVCGGSTSVLEDMQRPHSAPFINSPLAQLNRWDQSIR